MSVFNLASDSTHTQIDQVVDRSMCGVFFYVVEDIASG